MVRVGRGGDGGRAEDWADGERQTGEKGRKNEERYLKTLCSTFRFFSK